MKEGEKAWGPCVPAGVEKIMSLKWEEQQE